MLKIEAKDFFAARVLRALADIRSQDGVEECFRELVAGGGRPILYANHQSHTDGMAIAALSEYLRNLARDLVVGGQSLKGFATLFAASMEHGQQGEELKSTYDLLVGGARRMGVVTVSSTRRKDELLYGMRRNNVHREIRPFVEKLKEGYGIALLPEGTVEGGRHPKGESEENIKGMREVENNNLIDFFTIASRVLKRRGQWPFYLPVGLHGGFRIMQALDGDKPKLTPRGKLSLVMGALGLPCPLRIQVTLLMPFTKEEVAADLGDNWMANGPAFNNYAMGSKIAPFIPSVARGIYTG